MAIGDIQYIQNKIDSTNKLSADLLDTTASTAKTVTDAEKTTWNGKEAAITKGSITTSTTWYSDGVTAVTSVAGATVSVDKITFLTQLSTAGNHVFTYVLANTSWLYNSADVDLATYGITFTDADPSALVDGSTITVTLAILSPYIQVVTVTGATVTSNSKVDLQPDATAIQALIDAGCNGMYIANDQANPPVLTLYAIGEKPTTAMTIQVTVTEIN